MRTILIDDELHALQALENDIKSHCPNLEIIAKCSNPEDAILKINKLKPELVFTDIQMPRMNAFTMLQQVEWKTFEIVFVTAYNKYAVKAFELSALDYLVKPVDSSKLINAVHKVFTKKKNVKLEETLELITHNLKFSAHDNFSLAIPTSYGLEFVEVKHLVRLKASNNYCELFFDNRKMIIVSKTLKHFCDILTAYQFLRIHQSHLINTRFIKSYFKGSSGSVQLKDGTIIPISRSQKSMVSKFFAGL